MRELIGESLAHHGGARVVVSLRERRRLMVTERSTEGRMVEWSGLFEPCRRRVIPTRLARRREVGYVAVRDGGHA